MERQFVVVTSEGGEISGFPALSYLPRGLDFNKSWEDARLDAIQSAEENDEDYYTENVIDLLKERGWDIETVSYTTVID